MRREHSADALPHAFHPLQTGVPLNAGIGANGVSNRMHSLSPPLRMASKNGRKQKTPDMHREFGGDPGRT
ncbi:hypothetical protein [Bifidobacterium breve]|uniref:hypothetical protein n=1 Tax=Bifidobacterium breve TaxID=1685 RepID=UPI0018998A9B|nr:hypothetical protein [Bifidobacterium breve]